MIRNKDRRFVRFPYGHTDPILYCKPLRVCDVELQAGEEVLDVALCDTDVACPEDGERPGRPALAARDLQAGLGRDLDERDHLDGPARLPPGPDRALR